MKQLSVWLNVVLLVAVAVLYYFHFSGKRENKSISRSITIPSSVSGGASAIIGYVELDSLNEHISAIKEKRSELEREQKAIETEWENGYRSLERQRDDFLKRGDNVTQEEAVRMQESLMRQQDNIDQKKATLTRNLTEKSYKSMDSIQKELKGFLAEYNKDNRFTYILTSGTGLDYLIYKDSAFDITADVIKGMNERLKSTLKP
ncbi:MAG: OmpH family outer membrane protein [Ferruginibacter sp.]|nr:OmpH family outer membrane protein [Ferruginibacter sp.]